MLSAEHSSWTHKQTHRPSLDFLMKPKLIGVLSIGQMDRFEGQDNDGVTKHASLEQFYRLIYISRVLFANILPYHLLFNNRYRVTFRFFQDRFSYSYLKQWLLVSRSITKMSDGAMVIGGRRRIWNVFHGWTDLDLIPYERGEHTWIKPI